MKTACIYHSIDLDGWMSAAIVKHWYNQQNTNNNITNNQVNIKKEGKHESVPILNSHNEINFIGYNYGQPIPDLSNYDKVIMVDISFPMEEMYNVVSRIGNNLIWLDHHISAIKAFEAWNQSYGSQYLEGIRDTNYAACELTWRYFMSNPIDKFGETEAQNPIPEIVRLLGRYDCFGHKQVWKPVIGYEGLYEVSNHGNVHSLDRIIVENNTNKERLIKGINLSIANSKRGYRVVVLCKDGTEKMRNVHQLVAESFIPNIENKPCINHKDFNRLNNHVENLEWCTYLENNEHSIKEGQRGKKVFQMDFEYNVINEFDSIIEAEDQTGIQSQNIGKVCRGERETAGGFKWEYNLEKTCTKQFVPQDEETKVLEFQYGARSCISNYEEAYQELEFSLRTEDNAFNTWYAIWNKGKSIYQYLCTEAKQNYKNGFEITFRFNPNIKEHFDLGFTKHTIYRFICINKEIFNPINFGIDYHAEGYDGAMCWHLGADKMVNISFYNDNGQVDCSAIAKSFGGGGHRGSAGARLTIEKFLNLING